MVTLHHAESLDCYLSCFSSWGKKSVGTTFPFFMLARLTARSPFGCAQLGKVCWESGFDVFGGNPRALKGQKPARVVSRFARLPALALSGSVGRLWLPFPPACALSRFARGSLLACPSPRVLLPLPRPRIYKCKSWISICNSAN